VNRLIINYLCFQLAGVVAVEVTGGPTIDFVPGRKVWHCGKFLEYSLYLSKFLLLIKKNIAYDHIIHFCLLFILLLRIQAFLPGKADFQMLNKVCSIL